MPEVISRLDAGLPVFGAGAGKGAIYSPLHQDIHEGKMRAHAVQTINADPQTLYTLWRKLEWAPRWQEYVVSVEEKSETLSTWTMGNPEDPKGKSISFDSEIVEDIPGRSLAWHSITEGVDEAGQVLFEPATGGRGTRVTLMENAKVPGGKLGNAAAGLSKRSPKQIVIENLRHFKQLAEAGEIPNVSINPHGPRGVIGAWKERMYGENNPTPPGTSTLPAKSAT